MRVAARRSRRSLVAAVIGLALAVGTAAVAAQVVDRIDGAAAAPSERAVRIDPPAPVVVISDSALAALRWVPRADSAILGFEHTLDLESCRRLYFRSCYGREGRIPPSLYEALLFHGRKYSTLVVATGYNDGTPGFATSFEAIVARARSLGYARIVWWTLRSDVDYVSPSAISDHRTFAVNNQILRDLLATGRYPDVVLADWGGYTKQHPEWFVTDGVHYRSIGAWAAADYLTRKMAFLDGRACPVPTSPSAVPDDPCPDPDRTGPITDLEDLYPIGADGVLCYEVGDQRRFECTTDNHVIRIERELVEGMIGDDVQALQTRLVRLDLLDHEALVSAGAVGLFDGLTRSAVVAFQSSASLAVTGSADLATLAALGFDTAGIVAGSP